MISVQSRDEGLILFSMSFFRSSVMFNERMNGVASTMAFGQVVTQRQGRRRCEGWL